MKKLLPALALTAASLLLVGCDPTDSAQVIDKDYDYYGIYPNDYFVWKLKLEGVVTHNRVIWWKEVPANVWSHCQIGERWDADNPNGCD